MSRGAAPGPSSRAGTESTASCTGAPGRARPREGGRHWHAMRTQVPSTDLTPVQQQRLRQHTAPSSTPRHASSGAAAPSSIADRAKSEINRRQGEVVASLMRRVVRSRNTGAV